MAGPVKAIDLDLTPEKTSDATTEIATSPAFNERVKKIAHEIFEGHEEYLGMTPD